MKFRGKRYKCSVCRLIHEWTPAVVRAYEQTVQVGTEEKSKKFVVFEQFGYQVCTQLCCVLQSENCAAAEGRDLC